MQRWMTTVAIVATVTLASVACGGAATSPSAAGASPTPSVAPSSSSAHPVTITLTAPKGATMGGFAETELAVPAGVPIAIAFRNEDLGVAHNVQIFQGTSTTGTPVWAPADNALITGVAHTTYQVPALAAGTYAYNCLAHPATMFGTLTVG